MHCAIWYHLYNLKNVKLKPATLLKLALLHVCFSRFLNCANGTKSRNAPHIRLKNRNRLDFLCFEISPNLDLDLPCFTNET